MILDEKCILAPPPPYVQAVAGSSNPPRRRSNLTFSSLPSHLLLQIVYCTFPLEDGEHDGDSKVVRQRENLHWLETSLRLVNRALYIACMHILRSTYLPAYDRLVRAPYTSDPFPTSSPSETQTSTSPVFTHHRELATLDRFISLLAHEDRLLDTSDLHLPREEAYRDLFDLVQPKSRLEDLIAEQGCRIGVVILDRPRLKGHRSTNSGLSVVSSPSAMTSTSTLDSPHNSTSSIKKHYDTEPTYPSSSSMPSFPMLSEPKRKKSSFNLFSFGRPKKPITPPSPPVPTRRPSIEPIPFSTLTISFSPRSVALVYTPPPETLPSPSSSSPYGGSTYGSLSMSMNASVLRKKTLAEITRTRDEPLEVSAKRLVQSLKAWLEED